MKMLQLLRKARVDIHKPVEVRRWCRKFGCTEDELTDAVHRAGDKAVAVRHAIVHRRGGNHRGAATAFTQRLGVHHGRHS